MELQTAEVRDTRSLLFLDEYQSILWGKPSEETALRQSEVGSGKTLKQYLILTPNCAEQQFSICEY